MSIKSDKWIHERANKGMITPFVTLQHSDNVVSYGLSSYGYDFRVAYDFKIFTNALSTVVDLKDFKEESFVDFDSTKGINLKQKAKPCIIPPNSFALSTSLEYFRIPRNVLCLCIGKSSYARCGVIVNVTPLEPEWEGYITVEISNTTPLPCIIYPGEGIGQLLFFEADEECAVSYKDRKGKYQHQKGITLPKV